MKATVTFKRNGGYRSMTVEVSDNEPNTIVRAFVERYNLSKTTYITTIRCGRMVYPWHGSAVDAYPVSYLR